MQHCIRRVVRWNRRILNNRSKISLFLNEPQKTLKTESKKKIKPILGHVYAVPLPTGTYICGWVRAFAPRVSDPVLLVVFKHIFQSVPTRDDIDSLELGGLFRFYLISKGGIHNGTWIDLGESKKLKLASWPIPAMCDDRFGSKMYVCKYDEALSVIGSKAATRKNLSTLRHHDVYGYLMVEGVLMLYLDDGLPTSFHLLHHF
jgi:hypothetical protein